MSRYEEELAALSTRLHGRNPMLPTIALLGLGAGKTPQEIADAIANNCGYPPLAEREIRRAIEWAMGKHIDTRNTNITAFSVSVKKAEQAAVAPTGEESSFVEDAISLVGEKTIEDLQNLSPCKTIGLTPQEQAMLYCATVFPDDRHYVFSCDESTIYRKRTFDTLKFPSILFKGISKGGKIPNFAIANQFTGEPSDQNDIIGSDFDSFKMLGKCSYACTATLATRRLALIEFDNMKDIETQARFWYSVITNGLIKGLRTLVFSGGKSIHALVRVKSEEKVCRMKMPLPPGADELERDGFDYEFVYANDPAEVWKRERGKLSRITESSTDKMYRCDKACKDATRLTRFAGAVRIKKDGSKVIQKLIWASGPQIDTDVPIPYGSGQQRFLTDGYGLGGRY